MPKLSAQLRDLFRSDWTFLLLSLLITQAPYYLPGAEFYPGVDTEAVYQIFHSTYNEWFQSGSLPLWRPFDTMGWTTDFMWSVALGPSQFFTMAFGRAFGITNILSLFTASCLLELVIFGAGLVLLSRLLFESKWSRRFFIGATLASIIWGVQIWWAFRILAPIPWLLYFGLMSLRTRDLAWAAAMLAIGVTSLIGTLQYFVILQAPFVGLFLGTWYFAARKDNSQKVARWKFSKWGWPLTAVFLILGGILLDFYNHFTDGLTNISPGRNLPGLASSLWGFLHYAPGRGANALWELLWSAPATRDFSIFIGLTGLLLALTAVRTFRPIPLNLASSVTAIVFLGLSLGSDSFVATLFYGFAPGFQLIRHIGYFKVLSKISLLALAGGTLDRLSQPDGGRETLSIFRRFSITLLFLSPVLFYLFWKFGLNTIPAIVRLNFHFNFWIILLLLVLVLGRRAYDTAVGFKSASSVIALFALFEVFSHGSFVTLESRFRRPYLTEDPHSGLTSASQEAVDAFNRVHHIRSYAFPTTRNPLESWPELETLAVKDHTYQLVPTTLLRDECGFHGKVDWLATGLHHMIVSLFRDKPSGRLEYSMPLLVEMSPEQRPRTDRPYLDESPDFFLLTGCNRPKIQWYGSLPLAPTEGEAFSYLHAKRGAAADHPIIEATEPQRTSAARILDLRSTFFSMNVAEFDVTKTDTGGWLVYLDAFHDGWTATVNGEPAAIHKANLAFKAIWVEPATARVRFEFRGNRRNPLWMAVQFWYGTALVGAFLVTGLLLFLRRRGSSQTSYP